MGSIDGINLGWLCGILEGEGCFGCYADKRRPNTYSLKIQMESTDYDVIQRVYTLLGGKVWESNYPSKYKAFPNAKPSWRWNVSSRKEVQPILNLLSGKMSKRREEQIQIMLSKI